MNKEKHIEILLFIIVCMNLCAFGMVWNYNKLSTYREEYRAAYNTAQRIIEETDGRMFELPYLYKDQVHFYSENREYFAGEMNDEKVKDVVHRYLNMLHLSEPHWLEENYEKPNGGFRAYAGVLVFLFILSVVEVILIMRINIKSTYSKSRILKNKKDRPFICIMLFGYAILAICLIGYGILVYNAGKGEYRDYYALKEMDDKRKALEEQKRAETTEIEYTSCAYCSRTVKKSKKYCDRHTCREKGCSNGVSVLNGICSECTQKKREEKAYQKDLERISRESQKKKTTEMPDCDDYEDYEDFMDEWDGRMPDGSDAEDYWENW